MFEKKYEKQLLITNQKIEKYSNGIEKLNQCEEVVKQLQEDVIKL